MRKITHQTLFALKLLLDLMGVGTASSGGAIEEPEVTSPTISSTTTSTAPPRNNADFLTDLFGSTGSPTTTSPAPPSQPRAPSSSLLDLLGDNEPTAITHTSGLDSMAGLSSTLNTQDHPSSPSMATHPQQQSIPGYEAYNKNGLLIHLAPSRDRKNSAIINIQVLFNNSGSQGTISNLQFQAAVTKTQRLQMAAASNTTVVPAATEKQMMRVNNPQQVNIARL
jgi:AP-1 complex subunit gamma-1